MVVVIDRSLSTLKNGNFKKKAKKTKECQLKTLLEIFKDYLLQDLF